MCYDEAQGDSDTKMAKWFFMKRILSVMAREPGFWMPAACVLPVIWYSAIGSSFSWMPIFAGGWLITLLVSGLGWRKLSPPLRLAPLCEARALVILFWAVILLSVRLTRWPLRLSLLAAQPTLNRIADRLERGEPVELPCYAGLFKVRDIQLSEVTGWDGDVLTTKQIPCIWLTDYNASPDAVGFSRVPFSDCAAWKSGETYLCSVPASHVSGNWYQVVKN